MLHTYRMDIPVKNPHFVTLHNRALLKVSGNDAEDFLQGLVTNDIHNLDTEPMIYACLLTPQGKFLFDFFVIKAADGYMLDCEGGSRASDLLKRLNMYKLRSDVTIDLADNIPVYAIFDADIGLPDSRHPNMGRRSFEKPDDIPKSDFEEWDYRRIQLTIPDGSRDLIPEKSTMDEARMDTLNAIDYEKGCYVGQELTARMHYRGLGKKHLETVRIDALPEKAELRSSCGDIGLALVRQ